VLASIGMAPPRAFLAVSCAVAIVLSACGLTSRTPAAPTPADFLGISGAFIARGISLDRVVAGDAGCADPGLAKTAISFRAAGLDQATPVPVHLYIFGSRDSYQKLRSSVDACAGSYISDPQSLVSIDASPFVIVSQGPWGYGFTAAIRQGLTQAAGNGG
jgi:hypothetical protein